MVFLFHILALPKLFCEDFETLVTLSGLLLPLKSPVASAIFTVFIASVVDFVAVSRGFVLHLLLKFLATLVACVRIFLANDKIP